MRCAGLAADRMYYGGLQSSRRGCVGRVACETYRFVIDDRRRFRSEEREAKGVHCTSGRRLRRPGGSDLRQVRVLMGGRVQKREVFSHAHLCPGGGGCDKSASHPTFFPSVGGNMQVPGSEPMPIMVRIRAPFRTDLLRHSVARAVTVLLAPLFSLAGNSR